MERKDKWATYYAGNSAALAHYHLALSKQGGGIVQEPYARPASPPMPPQMVVGGVSGGVDVGAVVSVAATAPAGGSTAPVTTSPTPKKKSRWSTTATPAPTQVQGGGNNHGKSLTAAAAVPAATSLATMEAAAVTQRNNVSSSLYMNKFVQGKSLSSVANNNSIARQSFSSQSTNTNINARQASSPNGGGTKRKLSKDQYDSTDGHYGPPSREPSGRSFRSSSFGATNYEEDYVPLALNRPLGSSTSGLGGSPLSKKEKKKQKNKKKQQLETSEMSGFNANKSALTERAHRFKDTATSSSATSLSENYDKYMGKSTIGGHASGKKQLDEYDYAKMTVKGTCRTLEKEYLRLTSPPKSELVRPLDILEHHLANLKSSYYGGENGKERRKVHNNKPREYSWYCSQFKALRQDLTVQRIINGFAVDVYETHAKIALEEDDLNEYNQSQTQLKELYEKIERLQNDEGKAGKKGKRGKGRNGGGALKNRNEFIAYRIIYYVFLSGNRKYEGGSSDIFKIMLQLTPEELKDECIKHALLVRAAVAENDYHKFFLLQDIAPNMGDYLMDKIVPSVRQSALQRVCKAYRPSVPTNFVLKELGFDVHSREEREGGRAWMESCGCVFDKGSGMMITKDCVIGKESALGGVKNSLI